MMPTLAQASSTPMSKPVVAGLVVTAAFLVGGIPGALIVLTAFIDTGTQPSTMPATAAVALLALAAVATVLEAPLAVSTVGLDFALDRPVASATARLAGVAALVSVVGASMSERATTGPGSDPGLGWRFVADFSRFRERVRSATGASWPSLATLALTAGASIWWSSAADAVVSDVVAGLRAGDSVVPANVAPVPVLVATLLPVAVPWSIVVINALTAMATTRTVLRIAGSSIAVGAGSVVGVGLAVVDGGLAHSLTALLVTTAAIGIRPETSTRLRAVVAGGCLAGAVLSRPEAVLAVPVLAAWLVWRGGPGARGRSALMVVTVVAFIAPRLFWLEHEVGTWWPPAW